MAINSTSAVKHGDCPSETWSRCVTRSITAAHNFEVTNFSQLDGMGAGNFVSSSIFSVGGYDWRIDLFPDGDGENVDDKGAYVSAFLHFIRGTTSATVKFTLSLLGKGAQVSNQGTDTTTFPSVRTDWGWSKFIEKPKLQELLSLNHGLFTIRCVLTLIDAPHTEEARSAIVIPEPKLRQDLTGMLTNGEGADVTFSVRDHLFPAHKYILAARSMVFKAELFGSMKEKDTQCIKIDDMEPATFEALLHFMYTDSLLDQCADDDADRNAAMQHLLVAADRYGLERLGLMCEAKLCQCIDVETVAATLALAEQHHWAPLKDACLGFIASSPNVLGVVLKTDEFKHLQASCPSITREILDKVAAVWSETTSSVNGNNTAEWF
jgi:speckle-type POZ protein